MNSTEGPILCPVDYLIALAQFGFTNPIEISAIRCKLVPLSKSQWCISRTPDGYQGFGNFAEYSEKLSQSGSFLIVSWRNTQ